MKRIEFIAPVESMRGNLGSKQSLVYNPNNNRAFDSIEGQINPALNYEPRLIGARGKRNYFCVKTKSSVNLTPRMKSAMANLGGVGAIYSALVRDKMSNVYINAKGCYDDAVAGGYTDTFRKYMYSFIKPALVAKEEVISITTANHSVEIDNPWVYAYEPNIQISTELLVKFWGNLATNPIYFYVGDHKAIAHEGDYLADVILGPYNILGLYEDDDFYVHLGDQYLLNQYGNYIDDASSTDVINGIQFGLTNVAP